MNQIHNSRTLLITPQHTKCLSEKPAEYSDRALIPDGMHRWEIDFNDYSPMEYTSPSLLKHVAPDWADPSDPSKVERTFLSFHGKVKIDSLSGRPINPMGRTGITGRGKLGKWGANFAADPIVTRENQDGELEVLLIQRTDTGTWAIPGGMVDPEDIDAQSTMERELREETGAALSFKNAKILYQGYVDDPRNTDNAWMETTVGHIHFPANDLKILQIDLCAGDDAMEGSAKWMPITEILCQLMFADHGRLLLAIRENLRL